MDLNNRELATLLLLACLAVAVLSYRPTRQQLPGLIALLVKPVMLVPLAALIGYVGILSYAGFRLGIWNSDLVPETFIWFFTVAVVAYFNVDKALKDERFVRKVALRTVELAVLIEFIANLRPMSLPAELALQVVAVVLVLMVAAAKTRAEFRPFEVAGEVLLGALGVLVLAYSARGLIGQWGTLDTGGIVLELMLPLWMTAGFLPLLYLFALLAGYDGAIRRVRRVDASLGARVKAVIALVISFRTKRVSLARLGTYWIERMVEADSIRGARTVAEEMLGREASRERELAAEQQRLIDHAGLDGEDVNGRRLDRREFEETTAALGWLAACHMGNYRNLGRYREDMLRIAEGSSTFTALGEDHGIHMKVCNDGQAWWAWRRSVTGWCFAVGAAGPPPDQWRFDGPEPPDGPPGVDPIWGDSPFSFDTELNW